LEREKHKTQDTGRPEINRNKLNINRKTSETNIDVKASGIERSLLVLATPS
jgi:hypothetical protein